MKINDKNALDVLKKEFSDLGPEIIDNFRRKYQQHVDEAVEDEFFLWNPQSNLCNDGSKCR